MKTNEYRTIIYRSISLILLCFYFLLVFGQPDYVFKNYTLVSGTDLQVNAVYRYTSVKAGVDALVTIKVFSGGATLDSLDRVGTGYVEAFQPQVKVGANNTNSYVEFQIKFVRAGTNIALPQPNVYATALDIDGHLNPGDTLYEFDRINMGVASIIDFSTVGSQLSIGNSGQWQMGTNLGGLEFTGVDTAAKSVMYTVIAANVTTITLRSGADNRSSSSPGRYRSIYFKRFSYPSSVLTLPRLLSFEGTSLNKQVTLNWKFESTEGLDECVLERADQSKEFRPIGYFLMTENIRDPHLKFTDNISGGETYLYRLKMTSEDGEIKYSKVLTFKISDPHGGKKMVIYPSIIQSFATVNIISSEKEHTVLKVSDMWGRILKKQKVDLQEGNNNFIVSGFEHFRKANYIISISLEDGIFSKQIVVH